MARRLAAAVGVVLLVAGCGGGGDSNGKSVSQYIEKVNSIQHGLSLPLGQVAVGYRQLAAGSNLETMQPKLAKSARTIRTLERRVDALQPPPDAVRLDQIIRRLVHGEAQLGGEMAQLAAYVRDSAPVLTRATAAGKSLHDALSAPRTRAAQATALESYAAPVAAAAKQLAKLEAPPRDTRAVKRLPFCRTESLVASSASSPRAACTSSPRTAGAPTPKWTRISEPRSSRMSTTAAIEPPLPRPTTDASSRSSGRTPMITRRPAYGRSASRSRTSRRLLPNTAASVPSSSTMSAPTRFIAGEPMNSATNRLSGRS